MFHATFFLINNVSCNLIHHHSTISFIFRKSTHNLDSSSFFFTNNIDIPHSLYHTHPIIYFLQFNFLTLLLIILLGVINVCHANLAAPKPSKERERILFYIAKIPQTRLKTKSNTFYTLSRLKTQVSLHTSTNIAAVKRIHCTRNKATHHNLQPLGRTASRTAIQQPPRS